VGFPLFSTWVVVNYLSSFFDSYRDDLPLQVMSGRQQYGVSRRPHNDPLNPLAESCWCARDLRIKLLACGFICFPPFFLFPLQTFS
jgi:hypothetical protein